VRTSEKGLVLAKFRGSRGFTILELLTVVTVLSILMAIILPSLQLARKKAAGLINSFRQKSVVDSLHAYASDFGDRLPQSVATIGTGSYWNWTEPMMLTGYRARAPGLHRSMSNYLHDYIPDPRMLSCPCAPRIHPYLEAAWAAGDTWDHPETPPILDPLSGNRCNWWGYIGYLTDRGTLFYGPSTASGGGRESRLLISDYLGYDHWRNPGQFSSCDRFDKSEVNAGTPLSSALWSGTVEGGSEPNALPKVQLRATYLDGHVASYRPEELTALQVIWKVETGEPYPAGIGPGVVFIPREAIK
jgi:prepilin-type N-terminal cleavage/methylation domain-containing protein